MEEDQRPGRREERERAGSLPSTPRVLPGNGHHGTPTGGLLGPCMNLDAGLPR